MSESVLSKWGNSLALRVPKEAAARFKEGDRFDVVSDQSGIRFTKARKIKKYSIEETLAGIDPENNGEMAWGEPRGKEIW